MSYGKYIIVNNSCFGQAILFDNTMAHSDFLGVFNKDVIESAGFFVVGSNPTGDDPDDIEVSVFGESTSLELKTGKDDARYIKRVLRKSLF